MDFLATPLRRRILFACLYFSEGAPIGFLWLALPTRLKAADVALEQITWLTAILVLPWTFKFVWAPIVDVLRSARWTFRQWIVASQVIMGVTLLPLLWLDPTGDFGWMTVTLLLHAFSAATQDVAIDALCIAETKPLERGRYNGWMQAGMLLGCASMGGGALVLAAWIGDQMVVVLLIAAVMFSTVLVLLSRERHRLDMGRGERMRKLARAAVDAVRTRSTWLGLMFGLLGGASFKSLEVIYGPFLIDRGYTKLEVGWFSAGPMIASMIAGSLLGGSLADRLERRKFVALSLLFVSVMVAGLALQRSFCRPTSRATPDRFVGLNGIRHRIIHSGLVRTFHGPYRSDDRRQSVQRVYGIDQWLRVVVGVRDRPDHRGLRLCHRNADDERRFRRGHQLVVLLEKKGPG